MPSSAPPARCATGLCGSAAPIPPPWTRSSSPSPFFPRHTRLDSALTDLLAFTECTVLTPLTHIVVAHVPFETNRPFAAGRAGTPDAGLATLLVNHPVLDVATACERLGIS